MKLRTILNNVNPSLYVELSGVACDEVTVEKLLNDPKQIDLHGSLLDLEITEIGQVSVNGIDCLTILCNASSMFGSECSLFCDLKF